MDHAWRCHKEGDWGGGGKNKDRDRGIAHANMRTSQDGGNIRVGEDSWIKEKDKTKTQ